MERVSSIPRLAPRKPDSHKGDYGRVLVIAGSRGMPGAAILASRAALRSGAGLVTAAIPESLSGALAAAVPEATQLLLPELPERPDPSERIRELLRPLLEGRIDTVAIGPGLGTSPAAKALVEVVLDGFDGPQVVDADALNIVAGTGGPGPRPSPRRVWTPHPGELERLAGEKPRGDEERVAAAARFVERRGGVIVLKGHRTVVLERGRCRINATGNPGMATGGTGDVLTGMTAALLGQGLDPFDAASLAVHVHGRAGDFAAAMAGQVSLIASDIIESLPAAFKEAS